MAAEVHQPQTAQLQRWGFVGALTILFGTLLCHVLPSNRISVDFVCYFTAAKLLTSADNPYDPERQTEVQQTLGWDKDTAGFGTYDYLPYFYPPWFALACASLLPFGYPVGKLIFFFLNVALAFVCGHLLSERVKEAPAWLPLVLVPAFVFSIICVLLAQTSLIVLFLIILAWRFLDRNQDRVAGVTLAWLTIKPQLTAVLILVLLLWTLRQRRWAVLRAFLVTLGLLVAVCTLLVPAWPIHMLRAPRLTPPPTEYYPWIGNTWFLVLRALGLSGWGHGFAYLAIALPLLGITLRMGFDRSRPLAVVLSMGILTAFFLAPYARHYDFPVLLVPALLLVGQCLPRIVGGLLMLVLTVGPYVQFLILADRKAESEANHPFITEGTFFWAPVLLTVLFLSFIGAGRTAQSSLKRRDTPAWGR